MVRVVLDTTILVSAFLKPVSGGASFDLLRLAHEGAFELVLSTAILEETARVLLTANHLRQRYKYPDSAAAEFCSNLARLGRIVSRIPNIRVVRDPNDDAILACAIAAKARYLVSRDHDLISLTRYHGVEIVTPEALHALLRAG
jgi:putative PIN family toxin of toxin-antitoxin system